MSNKSLTPGELKAAFNKNGTSAPSAQSTANTGISVQTTASASAEVKPVVQAKIVTGRDEGLEAKVLARLNAYKESTVPSERAYNLSELIKLVNTYPKNSVLNAILSFFKENKDEEFLDEKHALQGIETAGSSFVNKIRVMYDIMMKFANNEASSSTINIGVIRNVFKDDVANWVAFKLSSTGKRR